MTRHAGQPTLQHVQAHVDCWGAFQGSRWAQLPVGPNQTILLSGSMCSIADGLRLHAGRKSGKNKAADTDDEDSQAAASSQPEFDPEPIERWATHLPVAAL